MTDEAAKRAEAAAEGLTLQRSGSNQSGFRGVQVYLRGVSKPFAARVMRGGKQVNLGWFATAEGAVRQYVRTPEAHRRKWRRLSR